MCIYFFERVFKKVNNFSLELDENVKDDEWENSILDFFQNEYCNIAFNLLPIFTKTAGPDDDNKPFLKNVFSVSQQAKNKGIIQEKLKNIYDNPPKKNQQIEKEIDFFVKLSDQVLSSMANLIYSMDEWLDIYREKTQNGQPLSQVQIYTVNKVMDDFKTINYYVKEQHKLVFKTIISMLEQKKGSLN
jgi:hypothetical protein